jgi:TonB-dependent SusC/RagA subfamily outer membrane receptor
MKYIFTVLFFSFSILMIEGCLTSQGPSTTKDQFRRPADIEAPDNAISLIDHLRRVPGVQVSGNGGNAAITIRGISSIRSRTEPLFVIDGQQISGGLQFASRMVPVNDIKSIRVLKNPNETAIYGVRGANGVIVIRLKKN